MHQGNNQEPFSVNILEKFYCDETGLPFKHCIECEIELIQSNLDYFIEKAIRKYPNSTAELTIFEFAICVSCATEMNRCISKKSLDTIIGYQQQKKNQILISSQAAIAQEPDVKSKMEKCVYSGTPIKHCDEHQIVGAFKGNKMLIMDFPIAICGAEIELIGDLLSEETKDEFDGFISKHFNGPPEFQELWGKPKLILV